MSFYVDVAGPAGAGGAARRAMPQQLVVARWLLYVLFGATIVGGLGLLLSAAQVDALGGLVLGTLLHAAAPGVAGWLLARRAWTGGNGIRWGLIAVQAWLISGAMANLREGSLQGLTQLLLPVVILVFLCMKDTREWFRSAPSERQERPRFSLSHMITWRRDRGQTALEYTGLIVLVVAIIASLLLSGVGGRISGEIKEAICSVVGESCPADDGSGETTQAGDGTDGGADGGTGDGADGGAGNGADGGTGDGTDEGATGGTTGGPGTTNPDGSTQDGSGNGLPGSEDDDEGGDPTDPYEPIGDSGSKDDDGDKGGDDKKEDCSGFWGCTFDYGGQVLEGLFVDGIWGDLTDTWNTIIHPIDSITGLGDYFGSLGDIWTEGTEDAGEKWDKGEYWDALTDWGGSGVDVVLKPLDDMFIGDDVRDTWNRGEETQAVTNVIWNVGSLFIPGYGEAKAAAKLGKLGRLGKIAGAITEAVDKAKDATGKARKALDAGDAKAARDAADEAQEIADDAKKKVEEAGECKLVALGGARLVPYGGGTPRPLGVPGNGTGVLAAPPTSMPVAFAAEDVEPCKGAESDDAREAQKEADEADRVADAAELGDVADKVKQTIVDGRDKQKTPKEDRFNLNEGGIDKLVAKAKDDPDLSKGEYSKEELASALNDLDGMLKNKGIDSQTRGSLASTVLKAGNRHQLAEAMAEVRAAVRATAEAADGTKVYGAVGAKKGRQSVDMGDGTTVDVSDVDDVDVLYKGKDGNVHAVEVKNTANAATKYTVPAQAKRLADWAKQDGATPPRVARYEIEQQKDWHKIFDGYQTDRKNNVTPEGTPARTFAENGLNVRIAGQDFTPQQIKAMDDAWNAKSDADKQAALDSGKMNDPKSAMEYLGVK
ncbi:Flp family type IVb pilin [Streptomyces sp. NPDC001514]